MGIATLLIVEDNETHRYVLKQLCDRYDYSAVFVNSGEQALEALGITEYAAVLLDLRLPGVGGLEIVKTIRRQEKVTGKHIPLIAVTAYVMEEDRRACMDAGFDEHLGKPFSPDQFQEMLQRWVVPPEKPKLRVLNSRPEPIAEGL
jgi:CheY-like chemotaxis protein